MATVAPAKQTASLEPQRTRRILAIDGGGIRGLIPALILQDLEARIARHRGGVAKPLHQCFDLIAGTSTGGIIAAALVAPGAGGGAACTAADLVALYRDKGPAIFPHDLFRQVRKLFEREYSAAPLEAFLAERLKETTTAQALTNVLLPAYDIEKREAVFMAGGPDYRKNAKPEPEFLLREAARGTSAAPTYFEPAYVRRRVAGEEDMLALVDGGVFANNPSMAALVEAIKLRWSVQRIELLSLGTGDQNRPFAYHDALHWGLKDWIDPAKGSPILSILMQAGASTIAYQVEQWLNLEQGVRPPHYSRIAGDLTGANDEMDDASANNLAHLEQVARRWITANDSILEDWAATLANQPTR